MGGGDPRSYVSPLHPPNSLIFSTGHSDHAGHARQNLSCFEALWIFYDFPGRKPPKHCPDVTQRGFVLEFRSSLACGTRVGPHTRWQKLGAFRQTAQALAVEGGGFGMGGGDPRSYVSPSHLPNSLIFSTSHSDHAGHARQNLSCFEALRIFYDFPGRKPPKRFPDVTQRAFVVGFRSFWPWGTRVGPHMHWKSWVQSVKPLR